MVVQKVWRYLRTFLQQIADEVLAVYVITQRRAPVVLIGIQSLLYALATRCSTHKLHISCVTTSPAPYGPPHHAPLDKTNSPASEVHPNYKPDASIAVPRSVPRFLYLQQPCWHRCQLRDRCCRFRNSMIYCRAR